MMKIAAWIILVLLLGAPVVIALWWLFPLFAGVCIWALFKYRGAKRAGKFLTPILLVFLLAFVIWLWFVPRRHLVARSYENNSSARLIRRIAPPLAPPSEEVQRSETEQRRFVDALARERLKLSEIASSLDLYNSADAVFVSHNKIGVSDDAGLGKALGSLHDQLSPHKQEDGTSTPDLLDSATLQKLVRQASGELEKARTEALAPKISADQISEMRNQLPKLVSRYQVDSLYRQVSGLEDALRTALKVIISANSRHDFRYDRSLLLGYAFERAANDHKPRETTGSVHRYRCDVRGSDRSIFHGARNRPRRFVPRKRTGANSKQDTAAS